MGKSAFHGSVSVNVRRRAVDWLDGNIESKINDLADIAGEYYGDASARNYF